MPSIDMTWRTVSIALAVAVLGYAVVIATHVLLGVFLAAVVYLVAWLVDRVSPGSPLDDMSQARITAAGAVSLLVLGYSIVIVANILLGVIVAVTVFVVAWITSPIGPVARWLDAR
ncbi:hypothetical protein [Haloplanus halobius]|uniref:hypothetical protein n=1 Tax=Haloplanus halobius TaxID=2934938 RepID=UPI00200D2736|nr:hypothetical protein [Haloplanus sp. XH21]